MKKLLVALTLFTTTQAAEQYYSLESVFNKDGKRVSVNIRFKKTDYTVNIPCNNDSKTINITNQNGITFPVFIENATDCKSEILQIFPSCSIQ